MPPTTKILLVDDDLTSLNMLSQALSEQYDVLLATSGATALELAEPTLPALILLDVMMPEMDGLETLRCLRDSDWGHDIPVILVTADNRTTTQVSGLRQGADDFIAKPVITPVVQARVRNVLERHQLLDRLRKQEEQYRRLSEDAPLYISAFLPDGTLTYVNKALAQLAQLPPDDLLGRRFYDWLIPEEQVRIKQRLAALTPEQPVDNHEQTYYAPDGQQRILQWINRAFFDTSDTLLFYQSIGCDITERKQQEAEEKRINEVLNITGHIAGVGAWELDIPTQRLWWSEETFRIHGLEPGAQPDVATAIEYYAPTSRPMIAAAVEQGARNGTPWDLTLEVVRADGQRIWVRTLGVAKLVDGHPQRLIGAFHDITERKRFEDRLKLAASVFEHSSEGITITDAHGTILDVNAAFTQITGYSREEVLGKNPRILNSGRQSRAFYEQMWHSLRTQGSWAGEIWNRRKNGEVYAELLTISAIHDKDRQVQRYIALFSDVSAQKEHQRQLEQIAHYDVLTGLPNRVLLADRLRQAMAQTMRRGEQIAVAYLDLDGFKTINDCYGHEAGDRLLIRIAKRIKRILRQGDTLARPGGDEFVVVFNDLSTMDECLPLLRRLLNTVSESVDTEEQGMQVSASLGVSTYPQAEPIDADQLLRQADQAMYQAKLSGKNRYHLFDAVHDRALRERHESRKRIHQALVNNEFILYYQPKVNMRHGTVIGAEALIRWQHPERGVLAPGAFLPLIDHHPLMIELGDWVIATAVAQISAWRAAGLVLPISVNIDALQLAQADFIDKLRTTLSRYPEVQASGLELEILETSTLQDIDQVSEILCAGRDLGLSFALDDFGTGYSSLSYLKRLPVETLKIDQSFVRDMLDDPDDLAILEGIISLAEAFRRTVIAEGVETTAHGELLLQLGCELGQGYAIARPMPAAQIPDWCAQWQPEALWTTTEPIAHHQISILFAMVEHRAWYTALWRYLNDEHSQAPALGSDQCHLGHWLDNQIQSNQANAADYAAIIRLHQSIHQQAINLVELKQAGDKAKAVAHFQDIEALHENINQALRRLMVENH